MIKFFKKFFEGIRIVPKSTSTSANKGDLEVIDSTGRLKYHNGTLNENVITETSTDTLENKTIDADDNTISNIRDAEIASNAQIERSKLEDGSAYAVFVNDAAGVASEVVLNSSIVPVTDANGALTSSSITSTELGYLNNATSNIQGQIDSKVAKAGDTMTGDLIMNANKVISSAVPSGANDLVNKSYVDSLIENLDPKEAVVVATTGPGTLASDFENGDTIDGVSLVTGDRILIKNQTLQEENGIYIVQAAGAPVRSSDANTWNELVSAQVFVRQGTVNNNTGWFCTILPGGTIGVNPITFTQQSGVGTITTDGQGIEITGNQLSLELDGTSLTKGTSGLKINSDLTLTGSTVATSSNTNLTLNPHGTGEVVSSKTHTFSAALKGAQENDGGLYGASDSVSLPTTFIKRLTNVSVAKEIGGIVAPTSGSMFFVLSNNDGNSLTIKNESSSIATAANRIITGSGNDILLSNTACLFLFYDTVVARWKVIGGSGGGGRITTGTFATPIQISASGITATAGTDEDVYVNTAGGIVNVTANPQISAGTVDGQTLRIIGTSDTNAIVLEDGDGIAMSGSWTSVAGAVLTLRWDNESSLWRLVGREDNY